MRQILMYFNRDKLPILKEIEGFDIVLKEGLKKENIDYIMKYYTKLGSNFNERFDKIKNHNKTKNKLPIFFDDISIKFIIKE